MKKYLIFLLYPFLLYYASTYHKNVYIEELYILANSVFPLCLMFVVCCKFKKIDFISPYTIAFILYLLIFIVSPMTFIITDETDCHGDAVMDGCVYGTVLAEISFLFLTIGYCRVKDGQLQALQSVKIPNKSQVLFILSVFWIIGAASCISYINQTGVPLFVLLFDGSSYSIENSVQSSNMKFLASFAYFMILPSVVHFCFNRKRVIVIPILLFTFLLFYVRGTRIFILILLLALAMLYTRLRNKRIKLKYAIIGLLAMICIFSFIGSNRKIVKSGDNVEYKIEMSDFIAMLSTNFDIYKPYYGLVENCPQKFDYTLGKGMIVESIQSLIPRILWPNKKSQSYMNECMNKTTGYGPTSAAMSWPNVAEYYMEFGILGVIVLSYIFGYIMSYSLKLYQSSSIKSILSYTLLFPTFFQLIIRGYTPINFTMYVCLFLPYLFIRPYLTNKQFKQ